MDSKLQNIVNQLTAMFQSAEQKAEEERIQL
jgi:hypothetical protein